MKTSHIGTIAALGLMLLLGFQNCGRSISSAAPNAAESSKSSDLKSLLVSINNRQLNCAQDSDCQVIAVGHKACGGPTGYVVASINNPDLDQVKALAAQSAVEDTQEAITGHLASTCEYLMPPTAVCVEQVCASGGSGGFE